MKRACKSLITIAAAAMVLSGVNSGKAWASALDPFLGEISIVGFNFVPRGWAECNGQLLPIAQNTALFSLLGTMYGGDGQTTFALPDLRGRVAIHAGQGPGLSMRDQGESGGSESITLTMAQMPIHTHTANTSVSVSSSLKAYSGNGATENPGGSVLAKVPREFQYSTSAPDVSMRSGAVVSTATATTSVEPEGASAPVNIMPPYLTLRYIIALQGVFPSRN